MTAGTIDLPPERRREIASHAARVRWAERVYPEVVLGKRGAPVCRQREYQLRCEADGRCSACGGKKEDERSFCGECRAKDNARRLARRRRACSIATS